MDGWMDGWILDGFLDGFLMDGFVILDLFFLQQGGWGWVVVLVGCLVHFLVNGTQVCGWYVVVRQGTDAKERKEDFWNMRKKGQTMLLSQVVLAILVTSFGTPHTVARRLHPDIFTSTGGDKYYTHTHKKKDTDTQKQRHRETQKQTDTYGLRQ